MAGKAKRLNKVAKEFNISISTIVDFLKTKGIDIDSKPNTKIEGEILSVLEGEFADDKEAKQISEGAGIVREKRESISLKDIKKEGASDEDSDDDDDDDDDDVDEIVEETPKKVEAVKETPIPEPVVEKPVAEEPTKTEEKPKEEAPVEEEKPAAVIDKKPIIEKDESDNKSGLAVLGRIDLDAINQKTRPDKKKKVVAEKPKAKPAPTPEPKKEEPKKEVKPEPKKEEEPAAKPVKEPNAPIETIKATSEKLTGPRVVGKIVLPVEREKANSRKKRKRIKKVNPEKQAPSTTQRSASPAANRNKNSKFKKKEKPVVTDKEIQKEIKDTLARLQGGGKSKGSKFRREKRQLGADKRAEELEQEELAKSILKITEFVSVSELATMMNVSPTEVIGACMSLGIFASINQRLDRETIQLVADEFSFETEFISAEVQESIVVEEDKPEDLSDRPPIVTVMGHVDHGKTSLLDHIRQANVTDGEAGGITQHIGAYSVETKGGKRVTFLDTPGHEAFTAMRARGAQVTDIAIIIVAADDDVMPQTKEAISHAQAAGVPIVFAINKIDKPGANPDKIKEQLSQMNILVEEWGGKYQSQEISAKKGQNIEELLEKVLLEAEILELKANPNKRANGTVVESLLDKGRGYVTTVLVSSGTMRVGDPIIAGQHYGKVKAMHNDKGQSVEEAGPSTPVSILGFNGAPSAGDQFHCLADEREVKQIASKREQLHREQGLRTQKIMTLDEIGRRIAIGDFQELNIIVKGDVDGSVEAVSDSLLKLSTEKIQVNIIHKGVGQISEADITLASASQAIIIGFQVRPSAIARKLAEKEGIDVRLYSVIYKAIEEIQEAMKGMLAPEFKEEILGIAEIRETFRISKVGTIAGCFVTEGKIMRNSDVRVIRDGIVIYTGGLGSLKRFKDDVKEVKVNYECGLNIDKFNDIKVGDLVEAYHEVEVEAKL
ncbi:translation initiation factor IF-2 [Crocinitomix catalasitica]|uniref:translation initiation factor IF-2 n=1 Tax=Crocinitomix catalasitica TaxID=184607 RepID=UPI00048A2576|nr:translation initiation factor IF-2 [Crocinitomix catalasitica]